MQLTRTQALTVALVLLDGARAAALPLPMERMTAVDAAQAGERRLLVDPLTATELLPLPDVLTEALHQHDERGLLDPVTGILGALPGVLSGVLGTVTNVVGGLLGSLGLGNLLITDPSTGAQGMHVYLVQASNVSMAMASAANVTDPTLLAALNMSNADAVLATLHVPVVNQTTMNIVDMCVTSTGPGAGAITASPCRDKALSQLFVYNSNTNAVYSVPDLLTCQFAAANATTDATTDAAAAPLGGTANIIMVERDDAPTLSTCNATTKAISFNPTNAKQSVVTVTPSQPASAVSNVGPALNYAAGDHNPAPNAGW